MPSDIKRIVLTGCSRGLGLAMWRGFAAQDHTLIGCARSNFPDSVSAPHRFDAVDISDNSAVAEWAGSVLNDGTIDLLINNAAIINRPENLWQIPAADFDQLLQINVSGSANIIRHFTPSMVENNHGMIINFSSGWGRGTAAGMAPYCASKFAIEAISQAMAQELPDGVGVVALNPGIIHTDMLRTAWGDSAAQFESAEEWATRAVDKILSLTPAHSGRPESV